MKIPGLGDIQGVMKQAQEMQQRMAKVQEELAAKTLTAESGGGMVNVTVTGKQQILNIKIDKELAKPDDVEILEDLIVAAVNKALEESQKLAQEEMKKATAGILPNIPGLTIPGF
ncbi:MAG: YbaB/EbfC family nucleoid-associated protein [Bacteroidetes bacterium]|nr:YbaB/EbfC family nucleoid-associated protein [Bacteroidota bacterium]